MDELTISKNDGYTTLTLSRAAKRNALSADLMEAFIETCEVLRDDADTRVVVVAADGKDFSVGIDLTDDRIREVAAQPLARRRRSLQLGPRLLQAIQDLPQTTIAAMHGYCLGGGGCIPLACDLRVAAADLKFGMPEVLRGMTMTWGTVPLLVSHLGPSRTKELLMTPLLVDADTAVAWGLANRRTDGSSEEARQEAERWAGELVEQVPPITASMIKQTVNAVANVHRPLVHMETDQYILAQTTGDFAEAIMAFMEKRPPKFEGR